MIDWSGCNTRDIPNICRLEAICQLGDTIMTRYETRTDGKQSTMQSTMQSRMQPSRCGMVLYSVHSTMVDQHIPLPLWRGIETTLCIIE